ncbi:MAG: glycogen/starch synthase [Chlamydiota bacterium]
MGIYQYLDHISRSLSTGSSSSASLPAQIPTGTALPIDWLTLKIIQNSAPSHETDSIVLMGVAASMPLSAILENLERLKCVLTDPGSSWEQHGSVFGELPSDLQSLLCSLAPDLSKNYRALIDIRDIGRNSLLDQMVDCVQLSQEIDACKEMLGNLKEELSLPVPRIENIHKLMEELGASRFHRHLYLPLMDKFFHGATEKLVLTRENCHEILALRSPFSEKSMIDELIHVLCLMEGELAFESISARMRHFDFFYGDQSPLEIVQRHELDPARFAPTRPCDAPQRIAMISYELAVHGVKYGGLGEAVLGLSQGLVQLGHEVSVITPKFDVLANRINWSQAELIHFTHMFGGVLKVDRCYHMVFENLHVYYLEEGSPELGDAHYAIGRDGWIYEDNVREGRPQWYGLHKRMAYFSSSAIGLLNRMRDQFHLAVINDWHGCVALPFFPKEMRLMLVVHNNHYQGLLEGPHAEIGQLCGNDPRGANVLLNGLARADHVVGVSSTFTKELQTIMLGAGIYPSFREAGLDDRLSGITNGGNPRLWNPSTDSHLKDWHELERVSGGVRYSKRIIDLNYSANDPDLVQKKNRVKEQLQLALEFYYPEHVAEFGLDLSRPLFLFVGRYESQQKGIDKLSSAYRHIHSLGAALITMGVGEDPEATIFLNKLEGKIRREKGNAWVTRGGRDTFSLNMQRGLIEGKPALGGLIRAAADYVLCPSSFEPCGLVQFEAWSFGSLVIGTDTGGLGDTIQTDPTQEGFNGFTYPRCTLWRSDEQTELLCEAIQNAFDFWNPKRDVEKQAIMSVFMRNAQNYDWSAASEKYSRLFAEMMRHPPSRGVKTAPLSARSSLQLPLLTSKRDGFYGEGINPYLHGEFGAHPIKDERAETVGVHFRLLAPNAESVSLLTRERMEENLIPMHRSHQEGVWELQCGTSREGSTYEYIITMPGGQKIRKSDPFAFGSKMRPDHASTVQDPTAFQWSDATWMAQRAQKRFGEFPLNIFEVHLGSFLEKQDGEFPTYKQLAHEIAEDCEKMGYAHVEIFGLLEHPSDESLGYQLSGLFCPTSRFGTLADFQYFVNYMHEKGIGVILDWVPYHFATNSTALGKIDGHPFYEDSDPVSGVSAENWKTYVFDLSKLDVRNFLLSSAQYACQEWHIDGFRVDAAKHVIQHGEHGPAFFKEFNALVHGNHPGAFTIAESWDVQALDTLPLEQGGLGFDAAWTISSQALHALIPKNDQERSEDYASLLGIASDHFHCAAPDGAKRQIMHTLSHDEFRDISLYCKSPTKKRANTLLTLSTIMLSPSWGYLLFMGLDYGKERKWNSTEGLKRDESRIGKHKRIRKMVKDLNHLYKGSPALWNPREFEWVVRNDAENALVAYHRKSSDQQYLVLHNYSSRAHDAYSIAETQGNTRLVEVFNTDRQRYGGKGIHLNGSSASLTAIKVAPLSTLVFQYQ